MRTRLTAVVLSGVLLGGVTLTACSSVDSAEDSAAAASQSAGQTTGAAADIAFAQSMIPHHQQAVEMADMALADRSGAGDQVMALARQIKAAQDPEIEQMTGWLQSWGAPTAMPGATSAHDMAGMDHSGHDMGGMTMSGMMTAEQMSGLEQSTGADFDQMWLTMMIEHHEGAITMAEQIAATTQLTEVAALADDIVAAQEKEIAQMKELLG